MHVQQGHDKALSREDYLGFLRILTARFSEEGYPLLDALRATRHELASFPATQRLSRVIADVEGGASLAEACSRAPMVMHPLVCFVIQETERGGTVNIGLALIRALTDEGILPALGDRPLNAAGDFPRVLKILVAMKQLGCLDFNENMRVLLDTCITGRLHEALKAYCERVLRGVTMRSRDNVAEILRPYEDVFGPECVLLYKETDGL